MNSDYIGVCIGVEEAKKTTPIPTPTQTPIFDIG